MHRKFILLCLCIILPLTISLHTSAHSGRTDANGGHTDHSTGEYHYHHGYSAHEHWDMDGDGDLDCPFEYRAPTKQDIDKDIPTNIVTQYTNDIPSSDVSLPSRASNVPAHNKGNNVRWVYWVLGIVLTPVVYFYIKKKIITKIRPKTTLQVESKGTSSGEGKENSINTFVDIEQTASNEKNTISQKRTHLSPTCVRVTEDYLIDVALEMGVSLVTALKIINLERRCEGLPPLTNTEEEVSNY